MARQRLKLMRVFARGLPLRRRVAYSLAIVRLILVPVIFLAIYYLFAMGLIVDRIVSVDATVAMQAERTSIQMLDARRAERNYLLLHDPEALDENRKAVETMGRTIEECERLQPEEATATSALLAEIHFYQEGMDKVAARMTHGEVPSVERVQIAVRAYEGNLNSLLRRSHDLSRSQLVQRLHEQTTSFDVGIAAAGEQDPVLQTMAKQLESTSNSILEQSSALEERSWQRVEQDHRQAGSLFHRAEWVIGIVSLITFLISIWVSFVLPREVVRPLLDLKAAVDHAASGNYEIEFDLQGKGEVVDLANGVRHLIAHMREKQQESDAAEAVRNKPGGDG